MPTRETKNKKNKVSGHASPVVATSTDCSVGELRANMSDESLGIFSRTKVLAFDDGVDWKELPYDYLQMTFKALYFHKKGDFLSSLIFASLTLWVVKVKGKSGNADIGKIKEEMANLITTNRSKIIEMYRQEAQTDDNKDSVEFKPVDVESLKLKGSSQPLTFEVLAGMTAEKGQMNTKFIYPNIYKWLFSREENNVLLYGPPGTGKTVLAKAAAVEFAKATRDLNIKFINTDASSLRSKWEGGTEKNIAKLFDDAHKVAAAGTKAGTPTKVIIFLDEVEQLAADRTNEKNSSGRSVTTLLQQMDGFASKGPNVMVLAATNLPWELDSAILRRFAGRIMVDLPDYTARVQVLTDKLLGKYLDRDDVKATQGDRIKNSVLITTVDEAVDNLPVCDRNRTAEKYVRVEETKRCRFDPTSFQSYLHIVTNKTLYDYAIDGHEECTKELLDKINIKHIAEQDNGRKEYFKQLFNRIAETNVKRRDQRRVVLEGDNIPIDPDEEQQNILENYKRLAHLALISFDPANLGFVIEKSLWFKNDDDDGGAYNYWKDMYDDISEAGDMDALEEILKDIRRFKNIYMTYIFGFTVKHFFPGEDIDDVLEDDDITNSSRFKHLVRLVVYLHYLGEVTGPATGSGLLASNAFLQKRTSQYATSKFGYSNADIQELMNEFHGILGSSIIISAIEKTQARNVDCIDVDLDCYVQGRGNVPYSSVRDDLASQQVIANSWNLHRYADDEGGDCKIQEKSDVYVTFKETMFNKALSVFKTTTGDSLDLPDMWKYAQDNAKPVKGNTEKDQWEQYIAWGFA